MTALPGYSKGKVYQNKGVTLTREKSAIKREQTRTRSWFAEREQIIKIIQIFPNLTNN